MPETELLYQCTECRKDVGELDKVCPHCGANLEETVYSEQKQLISQEQAELINRLNSGAGWFFWIAGLSLINSLIVVFGGRWNFIVGLGITQLIDGITYDATGAAKIVGVALDLLIAGVFVALGVLAKRKFEWAFILGMVLYGLDGLLFVIVPDFLSIGFHVFALFSIYRGYAAMKEMSTTELTGSAATAAIR